MSDYFTCPKCGGHKFGRDTKPNAHTGQIDALDTVHCHGQGTDTGDHGCGWHGIWPTKPEHVPSESDRLTMACHQLLSRWQREAERYGQSAAESGMVDGAHPKEHTAYQSQCATSASIYRTCAHDLERLLRATGFAPITQ